MVSGLVERLQTGEKGQLQDDEEDVVKNAAANAYGGGADTVSSTYSYMLALSDPWYSNCRPIRPFRPSSLL